MVKTLSILACLGAFLVAFGCSKPAAPDQPSSGRPGGSAGGAGAGGGRRGGSSGRVSVVAGKVQKKDTPIYLDGIGTVAAYNTVTVRTRVDGQLQKIVFHEGQDVKEGDLLVVIDPRVLQATFDGAKAKKAQDEALMGNAQRDLKRNESLFNQGLLDQQTFDNQQSLVEQYKAAVQSDQAAVENAAAQLSYTQITAPISGRTGIRLVDQGNIVHAADTTGLVVITQIQPISVLFTLPQQNWALVQSKVTEGNALKVIALDRDNKTTLDEGVVAVIDNQIDPTTGTIKFKATFSNSKQALWPGQFVNVRLDRKSTRLNSSHQIISYAVFCLKKKKLT